MASARTTVTLDEGLLDEARRLDVNVSSAARAGVVEAVRSAQAARDRAAYVRHPEGIDPEWDSVEAWAAE